MSTLRRIEPLKAYLLHEIPRTSLGKTPELRWVAPTDLYVDAEYQRDLRRRSMKLIDTIIRNFVWRRLKPPIVVEVEINGVVLLHCIDGQHTAIAAATRRVDLIPVFVVEATSLQERADSFVGHNRDRVVMDPLDVYKGLLKAGDPDATDIANVCARAGVHIKQLQTRGAMRAGDCAAVGVIRNLIKRWSPMKARMVLEALVKAGRSPISRIEIDAVEAVMLVKHPELTVEAMAAVIRAAGDEGIIRAKVKAAGEKRPSKFALYETYLELLDKQRATEPV